MPRRQVESLSGGERQRVALARALVDSPACVLLDEPLSALDPHLRAETAELLEGIQSRLGTTFLFITHDRDEALRLGHRIGVLNQGRLEQVGSAGRGVSAAANGVCGVVFGEDQLAGGRVGRLVGPSIAGDCGTGACRARRPNGFADGRVKIGVRPEDVQVGSEGSLMAQVVGRQFLGDSVVLQLKLADGTLLVADQRGPQADGAVGTNLRVGWQPGAAHLFPPDEEEPGA